MNPKTSLADLPFALDRISKLHRGDAAPGEKAPARVPLREGTRVVILGGRRVYYRGAECAVPSGGEFRGATYTGRHGREHRGFATCLKERNERDLASLLGKPVSAPLERGFTAIRWPPRVPIDTASKLLDSRIALDFAIKGREITLRAGCFALPHTAIDDPGGQFLADALGAIWEADDLCCAKRLSGLPAHGEELPRDCLADLDQLAMFVNGLKPRADPGEHPRLDTVFINPALCPKAGFGHDELPYDNVAYARGVTVFSSPKLPESAIYATSSTYGPTFIDGPVALRCVEGEIRVERHHATHVAPYKHSFKNTGYRIELAAGA